MDGTIDGKVAVEIESRVATQILASLLKLMLHRYPKKLLVLLPVHMTNPALTAAQCQNILARFMPASDYQVVVAQGSARHPHQEEGAALLKAAVEALLIG